MNTSKPTNRGELWVLVQFILLGLIAFAPRIDEGWGSDLLNTVSQIIGGVCLMIGLALVGFAAQSLGGSLTALPYPKDDGRMTERGVYSYVRHPMYGGVILSALGWALFATSPIGTALSIGLIFFFDRKAAQEEIWLADKYPGYAAYKKRVKKLIPFVY